MGEISISKVHLSVQVSWISILSNGNDAYLFQKGIMGYINGFLGIVWISIPKCYGWKSIPLQIMIVTRVATNPGLHHRVTHTLTLGGRANLFDSPQRAKKSYF
jgi:hypothetical protein